MRAAAVDSAPVGDRTAAAEQPGLGSRRRILQGLSAERVQRLETLVELKKLYRNLIRAEALLALPSPVYTPPEGGGAVGQRGGSCGQAAAAHSCKVYSPGS